MGVKDTTKIGEEVDAIDSASGGEPLRGEAGQRRPSLGSLKNLDAVVIDLQDAGVRFYTYETVVGYFLEAAAQAHIEIIVLDRPNPIGGVAVQGPVSDDGAGVLYRLHAAAGSRGMTLGELALYFNGERLLAERELRRMCGFRFARSLRWFRCGTGDARAVSSTKRG